MQIEVASGKKDGVFNHKIGYQISQFT